MDTFANWSRQFKRCLQKEVSDDARCYSVFLSSHDLVYSQNSSLFPKLILVKLTILQLRIVEVHGGSKVTGLLVYYRNVRVTNRTQCRSVPKVVLTVTLDLVETHSCDFSTPAIPWVAPPPGQMWFFSYPILL